jgi:hypothetical protein
MYITVDTSHNDLYRRLDALRGDKTVEQFAADCVEHALKALEFQQRQILELKKHPLLQFPEARQEFRELDDEAIKAAATEKNPANPIALEVTRLATAYVAQVNDYARQHGNRLPNVLPIDVPKSAIEKAAFHVAAGAIRSTLQKQRASTKTAA